MKRMSAVFPITCILLAAAGASGLVMDFMLAVEKMKDIDCPKFLAVLVIVMGLAWAVAAIITGINGYAEAKRVIRQQRKRVPAARNQAKLNADEVRFISYSDMWRARKEEAEEASAPDTKETE